VRRAAVLGVVAVLVAACSNGTSNTFSPPGQPQAGQGQAPAASAGAHPLAWSEAAPMPTAVSEVGVAELDGQVHVLGGYVGGRAHSTTHLVLDTATGR
jgi:hypothetical protein